MQGIINYHKNQGIKIRINHSPPPQNSAQTHLQTNKVGLARCEAAFGPSGIPSGVPSVIIYRYRARVRVIPPAPNDSSSKLPRCWHPANLDFHTSIMTATVTDCTLRHLCLWVPGESRLWGAMLSFHKVIARSSSQATNPP